MKIHSSHPNFILNLFCIVQRMLLHFEVCRLSRTALAFSIVGEACPKERIEFYLNPQRCKGILSPLLMNLLKFLFINPISTSPLEK